MSVTAEVKKVARRWPWIVVGVLIGATVLSVPVSLLLGKIAPNLYAKLFNAGSKLAGQS